MIILAEIDLPDLAETQAVAARLAPLLRPGDILAFDGTLGAGKTEFCRAMIHALGFADDVPSPTFNLVQVYEPSPEDMTTPAIWHMDLYRLESPEEAFELGIEEAFDTAVSLIEWPAKLGPYLPEGFLTCRLEIMADQGARKLTLIGDEQWRNRLGSILS
ncbi:tRNA (adenosine(37)-N6)-threonylcarbamoyltransferase complex ATPase subunit type 1 TsaE [Paremcibacter congregatus]|uniref:tRNA threonylcarbamoyladenosine biosynthesis protein TsaE n=1 Tax=Paremcibacter congregatus TaxID=2043170 RepID=A0A2G4YNY6_9PROT|nr:tRNA (adenosine(37)-N6)-threonylcarbamoyltransferase complex ATPase subunit type 1 TsaE [Paremcibacter congregatus]PHZ84005.1 tRNA (adenosine(37)-N6)-threonylcarbamoyltransferase complex ATPase subunit type 1 TsaE [Paremcibacter congregatus]QDE25952.1 tRNA (adenosine(37)-N6)-threonylcarbamoyltransferase complex ATPase subunit type 1 TsaE [Paremcibacter congregatus]